MPDNISGENKNKKVVVFGGAGFLGSHVADVLTDRGYQVVIFDIEKSPYLKEGQISIVGDINDPKSVGEAMEGCQIVYNFAAVADIEEAKNDPLDTVKTNREIYFCQHSLCLQQSRFFLPQLKTGLRVIN